MKKNSLLLLLGLIITFCSFLIFLLLVPGNSTITTEKNNAYHTKRIFPYQCIDTMKVSRDKARELQSADHAEEIIREQVQTIADMGANCIALGTPYEQEFVPYLTTWVREARKAKLHVWFRGNVASWEGWFNYPKSISLDEHTRKALLFIEQNPGLFADGDVFSSYVEPENGGPFAPVDSEVKTQLLRDHIASEQAAVKRVFRRMNKDVRTNWISMSGGVAKGVIEPKTLTTLENTVTLDHYVDHPRGMTEFIDYFTVGKQTKIVLGEFGAPIPDINGEMNEKKQAAFVDSLFSVLYTKRDVIAGVNYWTLSESSTALLDETGNEKPVAEVVKKYYLPTLIHVKVIDRNRQPLHEIPIFMNKKSTGIRTNGNGIAELIVPQGTVKISVLHPDGTFLSTDITAGEREVMTVTARFSPEFRLFLPVRNFLQNF